MSNKLSNNQKENEMRPDPMMTLCNFLAKETKRQIDQPEVSEPRITDQVECWSCGRLISKDEAVYDADFWDNNPVCEDCNSDGNRADVLRDQADIHPQHPDSRDWRIG